MILWKTSKAAVKQANTKGPANAPSSPMQITPPATARAVRYGCTPKTERKITITSPIKLDDSKIQKFKNSKTRIWMSSDFHLSFERANIFFQKVTLDTSFPTTKGSSENAQVIQVYP